MKTLLLGLFLFSSFSLFAQDEDGDGKSFHFGLGTALSLPLGDLKEATTFGVGFELQPAYMVTDNIEAFIQAGVAVFKGKEFASDANSLLHIPLLAGARFKSGGFLAGGGVGYGLFTSDGVSNNGFMFSPQIGYAAGKIEILGQFSSASVTGGTLSYAGIKIFRKF